jgi:hypothetical protein
MRKATDKVALLSGELTHLLDERSRLTQQCDSTQGGKQDLILSDKIAEINSKLLPHLRKQIHDAFNAAKATQKHLLSELINRIDDALNGIGTFRDVDVSEARLNFLRRRQGNARSHREGKDIAREIRAIEQALLRWKKQQEALVEEQRRRNQRDFEIQQLDAQLYGHLKSPQHDEL